MSGRLVVGRMRALAAHREAIERYLATAAAVPEEKWREPRAEGKWSADETSTHLRLALEVLLRELSGGAPMRRVLSQPREALLRWTVLPRILRTGRFPPGVRAPREARPGGDPLSRSEAIVRLRGAADRVESTCGAAGRCRVTHTYFGRISLDAMLWLFARHTDHHERQIRGDI